MKPDLLGPLGPRGGRLAGRLALLACLATSACMPPWFYILPFHPDAKLSDADKATLKAYLLKNKKEKADKKDDGKADPKADPTKHTVP